MHDTSDLYPSPESVALKRLLQEALEEAARTPPKPAPQPSVPSFYTRRYLYQHRAPKGG